MDLIDRYIEKEGLTAKKEYVRNSRRYTEFLEDRVNELEQGSATEKTVNHFIRKLQSISKDKRELPLVIECPNGLRVFPSVKMLWDDDAEVLDGEGPDKMIVTWQ